MDTVNVQMNDAMRHLLIRLIEEVSDGENNEALELELVAFRNALNSPRGSAFKKTRNPQFRESYASQNGN